MADLDFTQFRRAPSHKKPPPPDDLPTVARLFTFPEWMLDAVCPSVDPEIFFPDKGGSTREAKAICARRRGALTT